MTVLLAEAVNKLHNSQNYIIHKIYKTSRYKFFLNQRFYILFVYNMQSTIKVQVYSHGDFFKVSKISMSVRVV